MVENLFRNREGNPVIFDTLLLDKVISEPNITLLLNTTVIGLEKAGDGKISAVTAYNSQNQTSYHLSARYFCDASGDGVVGYLAGASYRVGAEERDEFGEYFASSKSCGDLLGHTIFLYTKRSDEEVKYVAPSYALKDMSVIPKLQKINPSQNGCNYWWFEYGGIKDTIKDSEEIKMELWKVVYGAWNHIKNSGLYPEAANLTLEWVGVIPGKRESRRFEGMYMLTQNDIVEQSSFADSVAYGGWAIDLHPAEGVYSSAPSCNQYHSEGIYEIPYRCYVSKDIDNLYFVGRLISATHVAFGSTRVMITSAFGGQAIGTAVALCKECGFMPAQLLEGEGMNRLRQRLAELGQSIPAVPIAKTYNLACGAKITASSTLHFNGLPFDGKWRKLDMSMAELLPMKKGVSYEVEMAFRAETATEVVVELVASQRPRNYTPNKRIERVRINLEQGERHQVVRFSQSLEQDCYAFVILRANEDVSVQMSTRRVTGILSCFNKQIKEVNNLGRQQPPQGSGFSEFEFLTPERRPDGENIAFSISPELECFTVDNLINGYVRPYLGSNAWAADWNDEHPQIVIEFERELPVNEITLYFDTDYDHPMETIQWGHPESSIPFCVAKYCIYNQSGEVLYETSENHTTINRILMPKSTKASKIRIAFEKKYPNIPISLFQIMIK